MALQVTSPAFELQTFIVCPANGSLPSPISQPVQLCNHLIRDQEPS